jgi:hypothetical protein
MPASQNIAQLQPTKPKFEMYNAKTENLQSSSGPGKRLAVKLVAAPFH